MTESPIFSDSAMLANGGDSDEPRMFALAWAESVVDQAEVSRTAREVYERAMSTLEQEGMIFDIGRDFRRAWVADVTLIWMANQLENWTVRHYEGLKLRPKKQKPKQEQEQEQEQEPDKVETLRLVRNAVEHMNEDHFKNGIAEAGPNSYSMEQLGGKMIIGIYSDSLFGLVDSGELEEAALAVTAALYVPDDDSHSGD